MKIVQAACAISLALLASAVQAEEMKISDLPENRATDTTPKLAFGQVIRYGKRTVFSPCRDPSFTNFEDASSDGRIEKALDTLGLSAGKKLYVEVLGIREGDALRATEINFAQTEGRCQMPGGSAEIWRAAGNDPAWMLAFGAEFVQVKRSGQPEVAVPAAPLTLEPGLATFAASKDNQNLSLRFERQLCYDKMANAVFGWTARVTVNGETLNGCAWQR